MRRSVDGRWPQNIFLSHVPPWENTNNSDSMLTKILPSPNTLRAKRAQPPTPPNLRLVYFRTPAYHHNGLCAAPYRLHVYIHNNQKYSFFFIIIILFMGLCPTDTKTQRTCYGQIKFCLMVGCVCVSSALPR